MVEIMCRPYYSELDETSAENSVLQRIFDMQEQETISDEQVQRVVAPIIKMIQEGRFDKHNWRWRIKKILETASACITAVTLVIGNHMTSNELIEIYKTRLR
jgi:hypothetical protein